MALPIAKVDFNGPPPDVTVKVGFALPTSYTIALVPPNHDFTQALPVYTTADGQSDADASHSLDQAWPNASDGWLVVVFGGIGALPGANGYAIGAALSQGTSVTALTVMVTQGSWAATFMAAVELQS